MSFNYIFISMCIIYTKVQSIPLDTTNSPYYETIAIYVPYAIKYVPVQVPDEYIGGAIIDDNIEASEPNILSKKYMLEDILESSGNTEDLPLNKGKYNEKNTNSDVPTEMDINSVSAADQILIMPKSENLNGLTNTPNIQNFAVLPVKEEMAALKNKDKNLVESDNTLYASTTSVTELSTVEIKDKATSKPHSIVKRQTPGFYYRPIFRYNRINTSRRRVNRPSRKDAMVGYLSDRDLFPTVA